MELNKILANFLDEKGRLTAFPVKRKMKIYSLIYVSRQFKPGRVYTEQEVNDLIDEATLFGDPATVRRELCGNHFLDRKKDCSAYWAEPVSPTPEELGIA